MENSAARVWRRPLRFVVTGAAGFIGSHLCDRLLEDGHAVVGVDNLLTGSMANLEHLEGHAGFHFILQDVCEPLEIEGPVDGVLHLASPASPKDYLQHPIETLDAGSRGTRQMLELARRHRARFLLTSTSECYGDPLVHPQPETYWGNVNPIGIRSCYDEGKRVAETLMMDYHRQNGVDIRIVRIFNTYGPRMAINDGRVISNFIVQALRGEDLTVFGDGKQTRSFCYVSDMVEGMVRMMEADGISGPLNLGNPVESTILELANQILSKTKSGSKIVFKSLPEDDPERRCPDITLAKRFLNWEPKVSLKEGLERTIEYFKEKLKERGIETPSHL